MRVDGIDGVLNAGLDGGLVHALLPRRVPIGHDQRGDEGFAFANDH